ncbi:hypothetical protein ACQUWY_08855, partial [Ralstonia pseudosolanacearum]
MAKRAIGSSSAGGTTTGAALRVDIRGEDSVPRARASVPSGSSSFAWAGAVAGDAKLIKAYLLYRTYHGSAMNP